MTEKESPFACNMSAIAADKRGAHLATIDKLFRAVESLHELPNGYSFRLRAESDESDLLLTAAQFIALERLCCPFFGFGLEIEREGGAVWLSLTGREGVKPFIMAEIGDHLAGIIHEAIWDDPQSARLAIAESVKPRLLLRNRER